jgi:serine/threonine protein kinase
MSEHEYELLERIGIGGMAEVFRANALGAEGFSRPIAIKRILPHLAEDTDFVTMFIDEAKIAVQLSHPNIVGIFDLGRFGDDYFIAMELVHGKDVRQILDREAALGRRVPLEVALHVTMKICEALHHAHFKGGAGDLDERVFIIHRDVSPQNVLVSFDGQVKVTDFGLAKAAGRAVQTQAGIIKGKLAYMSPEQLTTVPIDQRSDVFGVGILLWELLTGARLFLGKNDRETIQNVYNAHVPPPRSLDPAITPELERIVMRALAKNRDERYTTAQQMSDDLEELVYSIGAVLSGPSLAAYMRELFPQAEASARKRDPRAATAEIRLSDVEQRPPEGRAVLGGSSSGQRAEPLRPSAPQPPLADPYGVVDEPEEEIDDGTLLEAEMDSDEEPVPSSMLESIPPTEDPEPDPDPEESRKTIPPMPGSFAGFDDATPAPQVDEPSTSIQPARVVRASFSPPVDRQSSPPVTTHESGARRSNLSPSGTPPRAEPVAPVRAESPPSTLGPPALAAQFMGFDDSFEDRTTFGVPEPFDGAPVERDPSVATRENPVDPIDLFVTGVSKITLDALEPATTGQGRLPPEEMLATRNHTPSEELIARSRERDRQARAIAEHDEFAEQLSTMVGHAEAFEKPQVAQWEDETTPVGTDGPKKKKSTSR